MKNIVIVVDKKDTAIDRMARGVKENLPHFNISICDVHPKRPELDQIERFLEALKTADIVDFQYWKTARMLLDSYPIELKDKKKILAHHNPYDIHQEEWSEFDAVVVNNCTIEKELPGSHYIPNTIDLNLFEFQQQHVDTNNVIMVAKRIEGKKGILPVAKACAELGMKLIVVGSVSKGNYMEEVKATGIIDFRENIDNAQLVEAYHESDIFICNSVDNFESGPNPVLEAAACGVPIITRKVGHIPELYNGSNFIINEEEPENIEAIKAHILNLRNDKSLRADMRENAWNTVKTRGHARRAWQYEKLYWEVFTPTALVSVIVPTFNRPDNLIEIGTAIASQDYPAIELVIVADEYEGQNSKNAVDALKCSIDIPIKFEYTDRPQNYNLAFARNIGVIVSSGKNLVFLDDRYEPEDNNFIYKLMLALKPKHWVYGNKGVKKAFIENVSAINRQEFINAGMFNQSFSCYGFQSQELRARFRAQGFSFDFIEEARVKTLNSTKSKYRKKKEIIASKEILYKLGLQ